MQCAVSTGSSLLCNGAFVFSYHAKQHVTFYSIRLDGVIQLHSGFEEIQQEFYPPPFALASHSDVARNLLPSTFKPLRGGVVPFHLLRLCLGLLSHNISWRLRWCHLQWLSVLCPSSFCCTSTSFIFATCLWNQWDSTPWLPIQSHTLWRWTLLTLFSPQPLSWCSPPFSTLLAISFHHWGPAPQAQKLVWWIMWSLCKSSCKASLHALTAIPSMSCFKHSVFSWLCALLVLQRLPSSKLQLDAAKWDEPGLHLLKLTRRQHCQVDIWL